jgi:hypothetical protein
MSQWRIDQKRILSVANACDKFLQKIRSPLRMSAMLTPDFDPLSSNGQQGARV